MAKINDTTTFPNTTPALGDHVPGTDVSNTGNDAAGETVTFTMQAVMDLFEANMTVPSSVSSAYRTSTILSSTSNAEGAALIGVEDAGTYFSGATVEAVLAEIGALLPAEANADVTDETNVLAALSGATLTEVNPAPTDKILVLDASDSFNIKNITWTDVTGLSGTPEGTAILSTGPVTDGYVLTADGAGGAAWEAVPSGGAPEGTSVLSTGEAGGSKFLREDGDNTSSWQTVTAAGVSVTDTGGYYDATDVEAALAEVGALLPAEANATADQSDAEIETAYNNQVAVIGQAEAEAGVATTVRRFTAERIGQAIAALAATDNFDEGAGAPASAPSAVNRFYRDTSGGDLYYSIGTSTTADWILLFSATGGSLLSELTDTDAVTTSDHALFGDATASGASKSRTYANLISDLSLITSSTLEGTAILSTGEAGGTKYLREDGDGTCSWQTVAGGGDVSKVGTPVDGQIGVWTGDGTMEGDASLTFDTTDDTLVIAASGKLGFGAVDILSDSAGTTTLQNIDALDATTEATIEAAIDTLANLTSIQGNTVTLTGDFIRSGAHSLTLTTGATTNVTLPASGTLAILGANEFTGTQDFNGQQIEAYLNKVVTSVTGSLTTTAHAGNVLVTSGNVTVPTTAGFTCILIAGGAHTVTFNGTTSAAMASGDIMTIAVESGTVIHAVLTAAADKVSFT